MFRVYGKYDGDELESLTHEEDPWEKTRGDLAPIEPSRKEINHKLMRNFYLELYEEGQND